MLRILHGTHIDFIRLRKLTTILTAAFIVPGLLAIAIFGFNYSIEFTGGTLVQAEFTQPTNVAQVRSALNEAGVGNAEIAQFGSPREYVIRAQEREQVEQIASQANAIAPVIEQGLATAFGAENVTIVRTEAIGPKVGSELRQAAIVAMLLSFVVTLIYLAWRFEWRFGVAAVVATLHDFIASAAFAWYLQLEVSLVVVGALLTVIGYSLNDTIVVFDRMRENLKLDRKSSFYDIINRSVNETLPRTVITGLTTLGTVGALLVFGGPVIRPFALILIFGIIIGTFSSIYVAGPVMLLIENRWPHRAAKNVVGTRQVQPASAAGKARTGRDAERVPVR